MRKIYFGVILFCSLLTFQISQAGIYWLPDYLKDNVDTNHRTETDNGGGDRHDLTCSTYGGCRSVPANMTCTQSFRVDGTNCYKSCSCKSGYNRVNGSDVCAGCANPCDSVSAVSAPYGCQTAWAVCPSKCQVAYPDNCRNRTAVSAPYGCKSYFADCSSKCQTAYPDNCQNRTAVSTPYGCQTYFPDCSSKCQTAYPDNCHNRTAVATPYGCQTYFSDCSSKCQTAYPDNCHNRTDNKTDYGCDKMWADCASKCETGKTCTTTDCSAYKLTSIPANANYTSCTPGCGNSTTTYKLVSCKTDYTDDGKGGCRAKTCAEKDANTKPCGSTCIAKTACCGGCPTGQTCSNGTCVAQSCEAQGKKTCNGACIAKTDCCNCTANQKCSNGSCVRKECKDYNVNYVTPESFVNGFGFKTQIASSAVGGLTNCYDRTSGLCIYTCEACNFPIASAQKAIFCRSSTIATFPPTSEELKTCLANGGKVRNGGITCSGQNCVMCTRN